MDMDMEMKVSPGVGFGVGVCVGVGVPRRKNRVPIFLRPNLALRRAHGGHSVQPDSLPTLGV